MLSISNCCEAAVLHRNLNGRRLTKRGGGTLRKEGLSLTHQPRRVQGCKLWVCEIPREGGTVGWIFVSVAKKSLKGDSGTAPERSGEDSAEIRTNLCKAQTNGKGRPRFGAMLLTTPDQN